jgi:hypothetical protein
MQVYVVRKWTRRGEFFLCVGLYNCERNNLNPDEITVVLIKAEFDSGHSIRQFGRLEQHKEQRDPDFGTMWR